ncbi:hypothetical protein [Nocardia cyriacigeorgica]|uniref:hypothetical protein n=1 Tax=Nocardia cyriacigeorgica TaxID=135487 RepID=UPI002456CF8F|nr:hypothetical protein [Nocardia cyriacigeorgica]
MITEHDARDGYRYFADRIGVEGAMLLLNTDDGTAHITLHGSGFYVDVYPTNGKPGYYTVPNVENARRLGARLLYFASRGADIS